MTLTDNFAGGNSREILAVSQDDMDKVHDDLVEELSQKATEQLASNVDPEDIILDSYISTEATTESYDHKKGDEADSLKLNMEVEAKTIAYKRKDLADYVRDKLKEQSPSGFVLRDDQIDYQFSFQEEKGGRYIYNMQVLANYLPEIKSEELKKKLKGKTIDVAEAYLSAIPGYNNLEIKLKPKFPGRFGVIPMVLGNIEIEIAAF